LICVCLLIAERIFSLRDIFLIQFKNVSGKRLLSVGVKNFISRPMDLGGYDWIYGKACHWGSSIVIDPRDKEGDRLLLTSGNGVFACDNAWDEKGIQFYFQPDGVEECVSLDFVSTPDGLDLSAIGDYDGFVHETVDGIPPQYKPNMGSTSAIAVCPQNTDVWARTANGDGNNTGSGYYTLDRGKTWKAFKPACTGGKLSITELSKGKYRIINSSTKGAVSYTDDFGATWKTCDGIKASKTVYTLVDPEDAKTVYAVGAQYNEYWSSDMSKKEPTYDESHYSYYISEDYGATFTETRICPYNWELTWKFEETGDPAYLGGGRIAFAGANQGVYIISDKGKNVEHLENVSYAKCIGYGAPEKAGGVNTLYIYGKPEESDKEGIYRSTDAGKSWVCINTEHLYGGTGNGNYLVGDMDEFGKVYMSTVGCGIVYGRIAGSSPQPPKTTTTTAKVTTTTAKPATTTTTASNPVTTDKNYRAGDANADGEVDLSDVVMIMQALANPNRYGTTGTDEHHITAQGVANADVIGNNGMTTEDAGTIQRYLLKLIPSIPVTE
ncbi:MAG: 1,4-beta-glucanase, partial [Ruminococcus sp.]|nr:1,4-beta-glucanase [Ruminococcus sp.]